MNEEEQLRRAARLRNNRVLHYAVSTFLGFAFFFFFLSPDGLAHELGHALAAEAYGIPVIKMTSTYTVLGNIANPTAKIVIQFSGGLGGFLFSMWLIMSVFFGTRLFRSFLKASYPAFAQKTMRYGLLHYSVLVEGAYVGFLTLGFLQGFTAFWEGFFNASYRALSGLSVIALFIVCGVVAWITVFIRTKKNHNFTQNI